MSLRPSASIKWFALGCAILFGFFRVIEDIVTSREVTWVVGTVLAVCVALGARLYRRTRHRAQLRLNESADRVSLKGDFALYLRPFATAGRIPVRTHKWSVERMLLGDSWDLELALALALEGVMPIVAIGSTAESFGSAKLKVDDQSWFELMAELANRAAAIVVVPLNRPSTMREVRHLFAHPKLLAKTVFVMPPERVGWRRWITWFPTRRWWRASAHELKRLGISAPQYRRQGCLFVLGPSGCTVREFDWPAFESRAMAEVVIAVAHSANLENVQIPSAWKLRLKNRLFMAFAHAPTLATFWAIVLAFSVRTLFLQGYRLPTGAMEENLLIGDQILVNKFLYGPALPLSNIRLPGLRAPERGDVIVFKYPDEPARDMVKRVIGLPGERLELHRKRVYINGVRLDEPYVHYLEPASAVDRPSTDDVREEFGPVIVPPDHYFVMGDNRDNSQDSRYWGSLPKTYVSGKAIAIYWSQDAESGIRWDRLGAKVR
jgi:signal peptidase I